MDGLQSTVQLNYSNLTSSDEPFFNFQAFNKFQLRVVLCITWGLREYLQTEGVVIYNSAFNCYNTFSNPIRFIVK